MNDDTPHRRKTDAKAQANRSALSGDQQRVHDEEASNTLAWLNNMNKMHSYSYQAH